MKSLFKSLMFIAVAAMSLVGCKKDQLSISSQNVLSGTIKVAPVEIKTRTGISVDEKSFYWDTEDAANEKQLTFVEIQNGGEKVWYSYNEKGGEIDANGVASFKTSFQKDPDKGPYSYTGFYPRSSVQYVASGNPNVTFTLNPIQQPTNVLSFDKSVDFLVAEIFDNGNKQLFDDSAVVENRGHFDMPTLKFRRLVALGKISYKDPSFEEGELIKSVSFSIAGSKIAGKASLNILSESNQPEWTDTSDKITVNYSGLATDKAVWFTCIPRTIPAETAYEIVITTNKNVYTKIGKTGGELVFSASNITPIVVDFAGISKEPVKTKTYTLVTDVNDLEAGDNVIIAAAGYNFALNKTQNSNNRGQADITKSGSSLLNYEGAAILTLGGDSSDGFTFYDPANSGYLYAASSTKNYLKTQTSNNANGKWDISIADSGVATVVAKGSNTRNVLQYNNSSSLFSCYSSASQKAICIYKEVVE